MQLIHKKSISLATGCVIILLATLLMSAYFFAYTASGISWILNSRLDDTSATISIEKVSTKIGGATLIHQLTYHSDAVDIQFEQFSLQWSPLSVFTDRIIIEELNGKNLSVNLKTAGGRNFSAISLGFPGSANVQKAAIGNFQLKSNGKQLYAVEQILVDNIYLANSFFVDRITFKSDASRWLAVSGQFGFSGNSVINLTTESNISLPGNYGVIHSSGTLVGNAAHLRFLQRVNSPVDADISGRIKHPFSNPGWIVESQIHHSNIDKFSSKQFFKGISGEIALNGNGSQIEIHSDLSLLDVDEKRWSANLTAQTIDKLVNFRLAVDRLGSNVDSRARFEGSFDLVTINSSSDLARGIKLKGDWNDIRLTLFDNNTIFTKSGNIDFDGAKLSSQLTINDFQFENLGPTITQLVMNTTNTQTNELSFNGKASTANGSLNLSGKITRSQEKYQLDTLLLSGRNFPLVRKPQAHIVVSPDVSFVRKNKTLTSTGIIKIPMANIQLRQFQDTLSQIASYIGADKQKIKSKGFVDIEFGKSVWMHGFGLNAHVTGGLSLKDFSSHDILASGELKVLRGKYRRLRQDHQLMGGRLKFNNHQIDNPELDLRVVQRKPASNNNQQKIIGRLQKLFRETELHSQKVEKPKHARNSKNLALNNQY